MLLALAAALRLVGIAYGLPLPVLNPDERNIVPRAWSIGHGERLDPAFYDYPSLLFTVLAPVQAPFASPSFLAARLAAVVIGLGGVAAAWCLGARAYGRRAAVTGALTVAAATTHVAYSRMAVTDVLLTLLVTVAIALALDGRLAWAGVAVGLAASAKYPGVLALVPVVVAGWGRWRALACTAGLAVVSFAATSPFVLWNHDEARADLSRVQHLARQGWLGFETDAPSLLGFASRLWHGLGPVVLLAAVGLVVAARSLTRSDRVLVAFVVAYCSYLAPLGAHFDRYVLPLVPVAGVFAGRVGRLAPLAVAALAVPLVWSVRDAARLVSTDTRVVAEEWVASRLPASAVVALDPSTLVLPGRRVVRLALPGPGVPPDDRRDLGRLRNAGVGYVVVSGAVADRVHAAAGRYPAEERFYALLEREATTVLSLTAGNGLGGPWVKVYRLG